MVEPEESIDEDDLDQDQSDEADALVPNGGPSVAGLLLIGLGIGCIVHPPLWADWMDDWAAPLLNLPIAGALIGLGIGVLGGNGKQGARFGFFAGVCSAALYWMNYHLHHRGR